METTWNERAARRTFPRLLAIALAVALAVVLVVAATTGAGSGSTRTPTVPPHTICQLAGSAVPCS